MALSIAQVLVMLAQIGCPGVTRMLLDSYGFRGTVAIYAALSLHCVPAALAMQPVKWHLKKKLIDCDETGTTVNLIRVDDLIYLKGLREKLQSQEECDDSRRRSPVGGQYKNQ